MAETWREYNARWKKKYPGRDQEVKYRHRYGIELSEIRPKPKICEICGRSHRKIVFDHCHATSAFRGWICDSCNMVLGNMKDDIYLLERMIAYLKRNSSNYGLPKINQTNQQEINAARR